MDSKELPISRHENDFNEQNPRLAAKSLETSDSFEPDWTPEEEKKLV